jgi:hypothetical protein
MPTQQAPTKVEGGPSLRYVLPPMTNTPTRVATPERNRTSQVTEVTRDPSPNSQNNIKRSKSATRTSARGPDMNSSISSIASSMLESKEFKKGGNQSTASSTTNLASSQPETIRKSGNVNPTNPTTTTTTTTTYSTDNYRKSGNVNPVGSNANVYSISTDYDSLGKGATNPSPSNYSSSTTQVEVRKSGNSNPLENVRKSENTNPLVTNTNIYASNSSQSTQPEVVRKSGNINPLATPSTAFEVYSRGRAEVAEPTEGTRSKSKGYEGYAQTTTTSGSFSKSSANQPAPATTQNYVSSGSFSKGDVSHYP